jgi:hypothetical protein
MNRDVIRKETAMQIERQERQTMEKERDWTNKEEINEKIKGWIEEMKAKNEDRM